LIARLQIQTARLALLVHRRSPPDLRPAPSTERTTKLLLDRPCVNGSIYRRGRARGVPALRVRVAAKASPRPRGSAEDSQRIWSRCVAARKPLVPGTVGRPRTTDRRRLRADARAPADQTSLNPRARDISPWHRPDTRLVLEMDSVRTYRRAPWGISPLSRSGTSSASPRPWAAASCCASGCGCWMKPSPNSRSPRSGPRASRSARRARRRSPRARHGGGFACWRVAADGSDGPARRSARRGDHPPPV
jgi:hypothetical protein